MNRYLIIISLLVMPTALSAQNLEEVYMISREQDPTYKKAMATFLATKQNLPQAVALSLPTVSATVSSTGTDVSSTGNYNDRKYQLDLSQPIIDAGNFLSITKARLQVSQAEAVYRKAEQDLILSTTKQYFAVLKAQNDVDFQSAKLAAFKRHLEQTEQRFKVGLSAITNVHEAKARSDDANAQLIAARNKLSDQYEILGEILGQDIHSISGLRHNALSLEMPKPNNINDWVKSSLENNLTLQGQKYKIEQDKTSIQQKRADHFPTLSLTGQILKSKGAPSSGIQSYSTTKKIGLSLSIPIFQGGAVLSETEQAAQTLSASKSEYTKLYRNVESKTKRAFRGIKTQLSEITALQQATISNESALKATESAYEVGTRTIVDVLNAQSELLEAKKKLKNAHYDFILEMLDLKATAGSLNSGDVTEINNWLKS